MNWLTVKEAAEATGFREAQIYLWVAEKRIRHMRLGKQGCRGSIRVTLADVSDFIESQVVEPEVKPKKRKPVPLGQYRHLDAAKIGRAAPTASSSASR